MRSEFLFFLNKNTNFVKLKPVFKIPSKSGVTVDDTTSLCPPRKIMRRVRPSRRGGPGGRPTARGRAPPLQCAAEAADNRNTIGRIKASDGGTTPGPINTENSCATSLALDQSEHPAPQTFAATLPDRRSQSCVACTLPSA